MILDGATQLECLDPFEVHHICEYSQLSWLTENVSVDAQKYRNNSEMFLKQVWLYPKCCEQQTPRKN